MPGDKHSVEQRLVGFSKTPVEEELVGRVAWQIQLRWFAAAGVLVAAWFATSVLGISLPQGPLYAVGLAILLYNAAFWYYLRQLERQSVSEASVFDRFAKVQTSLDWLAMILLVHFTGGIESPLLFYFFFHLIMASILLSPKACYFFATLAALAVAGLALLEYSGLIPHVPLGFVAADRFQDELFIASVLFFFTFEPSFMEVPSVSLDSSSSDFVQLFFGVEVGGSSVSVQVVEPEFGF